MGICSGAGIALRVACADERVVAVVPVNSRGYLSSPNGGFNSHSRPLALLRHYWRIAFSSSFRSKNWLKVLTGKVNYRSFIGAIGRQLQNLFSLERQSAVRLEHPFKSDLRSLLERGVRMLFIHAEGDEGLDFVEMILGDEIQRWSHSQQFGLQVIEGANHTFALLWTQERLLQIICEWTEQIGNLARGDGQPALNDCASGSFRLAGRGD
jgi:hypothetical protein